MARFVLCALLITLTACSSESSPVPPTPVKVVAEEAGSLSPAPAPTATSPNIVPVASFIATFDRRVPSLSFVRTPSVHLLDVVVVPDEQGDGGTATKTPGDADLFTPSGGCVAGAQNTIHCLVQMTWGDTTRALMNPVAVITGEYDLDMGDASTTLDDATGFDGANPLGLVSDHGLWTYTNTAINPSPGTSETNGPYYLTAQGTGFNQGYRTWVLKNGTSDRVQYAVTVYASKTFQNYQQASASSSVVYVDACGAGTSTTDTFVTGVTLPFDFTLWTTTYRGSSSPATTVNFSNLGEITLGGTGLDSAGPSGSPPSTSFSSPAIWPFFDSLVYGSGGKMCAAVIGSAPKRQFVVEWRGLDFAGTDTGSALDFEAFLNEGTSQVDVVYNTMVDGNSMLSRAEGSTAWMGTQNAGASLFAGDFDDAAYGSGVSFSLVPQP